MDVTLYTKPRCELCEAVKQLLHNSNIPYSELVIGDNITREDVLKRFPDAKVAPVIVVNGIQFNIEGLKFLIEKEKEKYNG